MGVNAHLRWVAVAATVLGLAACPAALAAGPAGPDAAPSSGSSSAGPSPDPAPMPSSRQPAVVAKRSVAVATTQTPVRTTSSTPAAATPAPPATTVHRQATPERKHRATKRKPVHRTPVVAHAPALPKLDPTRLVAPATNADDAGRARKLAAGALSLLILSFASALLLAVVARGDRRRVAR
jgi:hypothetical protein